MAEMLVVVAVTAVIMVAVSTALLNSARNQKKFAQKVEQHADVRVSSKALINVAIEAGLSKQFVHLPIPATCSSLTAPCVRELNSDQNFVAATINGLSSIEFYRDDTGTVEALDQPPGKVNKTGKFALSDAIIKGQFYATWPLAAPATAPQSADPTSPPFLVLSMTDQKLAFMYNDFLGNAAKANTYDCTRVRPQVDMNSPNPVPNPAVTIPQYGFYNISDTTTVSAQSVSALIGNIMLVYNSADPSQHFFQLVSDAVYCGGLSSGMTYNDCKNKWEAFIKTGSVRNLGSSAGAAATPPAPNFPANTPASLVALKLIPIDSATAPRFWQATAANTYPYAPTAGTLGLSLPSTIWGISGDSTNQSTTMYLFPTSVTSYFEMDGITGKRMPAFRAGTSSNWDTVQKLSAHGFCGSVAAELPLTAIPVLAKAIYLKPSPIVDKPNNYGLYMSTFKGNSNCVADPSRCAMGDPEIRILDEVAGPVVVARKLGTNELSVFTYPQGGGVVAPAPPPGGGGMQAL